MRSALLGLAALSLATHAALAADPIRPDPKLTPGAVRSVDLGAICGRSYSKSVRHTSGRLKAEVYREYGIHRKGGHYEIDHLIPIGVGGADVRENLWPENRDTQPWNASVKDRLENYLHGAVCAHRLPIEQAQYEIAQDWIAPYQKYLGQP